MRNISVSDGTTPETLSYTQKGQFDFGWGISGSYGTYAPSGTFTGDTFTITGDGNDGSVWSWLSGFIITDQPVINAEPVATSVPTGGTISLSASAIGVGTLTYQWKIGGVDIPGATASTFTKASASTGDAGDYTVVVTNVAGNVTSQTAHVTVAQPVSLTWDTDTGTSGGQAGSGTWDTSNSNWWNGTANVSWGAMDLATFGAGGVGTSTVTLAADTSISGLTFDGNYDITTSTGNTLTLAGTPTLAVNSDSSIHVSLLGTAAITKTGTGTLTLAGSGSTFTGATTINNGKLVLGSQRGLGATSGITLVAGTQVNLNGQSAGALSTGGYTWTIAGDGGDGEPAHRVYAAAAARVAQRLEVAARAVLAGGDGHDHRAAHEREDVGHPARWRGGWVVDRVGGWLVAGRARGREAHAQPRVLPRGAQPADTRTTKTPRSCR